MAINDYNNEEIYFKDKCLRIYEALVSGKGVNHIIDVASDVINNPISLSDSSFRNLAYSKVAVNDPIWNEIVSFGYVSFEVVKEFNREKVIEKIAYNNTPIIVNTGIGKHMSRILGKVMVFGKIVAYIGIFEVNHKLDEEDVKLAQILCSVLSLELAKDPVISSLTGSLYENLLIELINGLDINNVILKERLKSSLWIPRKNFYVIYIPIEKKSDTRLKVDYLRRNLEGLFSYFKTVYLNDAIILLMNYDDKKELTSIWDNISPLLSDNQLNAGVSFEFKSLEKLRTYYQQARTAYYIGNAVDSGSLIHYYDDYYHIYLLNKLSANTSLYDYCHKGILKLLEHDKENSTEYFSTFNEFINNSFSITKAAKKLYIHKNTMLHRLERIKEISEMNILEEEDMFMICLTYKIVDFLKLYDKVGNLIELLPENIVHS